VRRSSWLALALIAPALAACGGGEDTSSTDLQKPPLTVPGDSTDLTDKTGTDSTSSTESTDTAPSTGPLDQPNPGNGGVPAPDQNQPPADQPAPQDSPSNDTPPEPGSPADRFEQFCAQNPGAC
jgi:hypothetical protein